MTISPRQLTDQVTHTIRYTTSYAVAGNVAVNIGSIPDGAVVSGTDAFSTDAWNSGTTDLYNLGFTGNGTDLVSAGNIVAAGLTTTAAPIAASKTTLQATAKTGTQVYFQRNSTGAAATGGNLTVVIKFYPDFTGGVVGQAGG